MQVRNFYEDPVPSVRSPLNSIALSPDSIKYSGYDLQNVQDEFSDFQSILPSPSSCRLHGDGNCRKHGRLIRWAQNLLGQNRKECFEDHQGVNE